MADEKKPLIEGIRISPTNQEEFNTQLTEPEKILSTENKVNKLFKTIPRDITQSCGQHRKKAYPPNV